MGDKTKSASAKADKVKKEKGKKKDSRKEEKSKTTQTGNGVFSLLADDQTVDPTLSSLFAAKSAPVIPVNTTIPEVAHRPSAGAPADASDNEEEPTHADEDVIEPPQRKRKRKRENEKEEELEDAYIRRVLREEEKENDDESSRSKRTKLVDGSDEDEDIEDEQNDILDVASEVDEAPQMSPPPQHETQQAATDEVEKANRTVFLGNVSTSAISSKSARKSLEAHLKSFFPELNQPAKGEPKHALESIRFRSTPYASAIPKKAAFAKKELMDATTKCTNAYAVYSAALLAREAARRLNGTIVLDRHLRVDELAHPAQVDNRRCVFVGNLGFVDDESNIQDANEEDGREVRKRGKIPSDVEEGLWRTFSKCGKVESVRVIRDSTTRVGKGIAYVQFEDENGVEAALLYNEKKFPPMLPRKLRVSRAKAPKKNARPGTGRPTAKPSFGGYQRKFTGAESSQMGRAEKMLGKAAAAHAKKARNAGDLHAGSDSIKRPEQFVFEGRRATGKSGNAGLKLGGKKKKGAKPTGRSAKRGAAFKAAGKKKAKSSA